MTAWTRPARMAKAVHSASVAVYYDVLAVALPAITWPSFVTHLADSVLTTPLVPDGLIPRVPDGPGFGVTLDPEKVRRYTVER